MVKLAIELLIVNENKFKSLSNSEIKLEGSKILM